MKKIFVAIPPEYNLDANELKAHIAKIEKIAHKAEIILDEYLEIIDMSSPMDCLAYKPQLNRNRKYCIREFLFHSIRNIPQADLAVFSENWKSSQECKVLHNTAVAIDIPVIDIDTFDKEIGEHG